MSNCSGSDSPRENVGDDTLDHVDNGNPVEAFVGRLGFAVFMGHRRRTLRGAAHRLTDPSLRFIAWHDGRMGRVEIPAVGEIHDLLSIPRDQIVHVHSDDQVPALHCSA